jgi:ribosomal-protein-alanine N-acetyltransferase
MTPIEVLTNLPTIETKRLIIRKLVLPDLEDLFECSSNPEISKFTLWDSHKTINDSKDFLVKCIQQYSKGQPPVFGIELKDELKLIGTIGFGSIDFESKRAEFGYALHVGYWKQNITTEASLAILQFGFRTLELERIFATCFTDNIGSYRVMEKVGMTYEGILRSYHSKNGQRIDARIYAITQEDWFQNRQVSLDSISITFS